jgi:hypothetical protein
MTAHEKTNPSPSVTVDRKKLIAFIERVGRHTPMELDTSREIAALIPETTQQNFIHASYCSGSHIVFANGLKTCLDTEMRSAPHTVDQAPR